MEQKTTRPTLENTYLKMAQVIGERSTCRHRDQGAILVKDSHVVSVGYNGAAPGQPHCISLGYCRKAEGLPCRAEGLHAESNALAFAAKLGIPVSGSILYSVYSPCRTCCNMLKVAGVTKVVYMEVYSGFPEGPDYMKELGIWFHQVETNLAKTE